MAYGRTAGSNTLPVLGRDMKPLNYSLKIGGFLFAPDAGERGLDFSLEAGNQFAVGGDQCLLGFDLGDDGLLHGRWLQQRANGPISNPRHTPRRIPPRIFSETDETRPEMSAPDDGSLDCQCKQ